MSNKKPERYYFVHRSVPRPDYQYKSEFKDWEKPSLKERENLSFVGLPIYLDHKVPVGEVLFEWKSKDGSTLALSYIENTHEIARLAISEIKRGLLKGVSPFYGVSYIEEPKKVTIKKEFTHISLIENPDFAGEGGCEIFWGIPENDLNIKFDTVLKKVEKLYSKSTEEPQKVNSQVEKGVGDLLSEIQSKSQTEMSTTQQAAPAVPQQQQQQQQVPQTQQPVNVNAPLNTPAQTTPSPNVSLEYEPKIDSASALSDALIGDQRTAKKLSPEELENALLVIAQENKELRDSMKKIPTTESDPNKRQRTEATQQPLDNSHQARESALALWKDRFDAIMDGYNELAKTAPPANAVNPDRFRDTMNGLYKVVEGDPFSPMAGHVAKAISQAAGVMQHAAGSLSNLYTRERVEDVKSSVTANHIKDFLRKRSHGQMDAPQQQQQKPVMQNLGAPGTVAGDITESVMRRIGAGDSGNVRIMNFKSSEMTGQSDYSYGGGARY
jgi:hypothetical protein